MVSNRGESPPNLHNSSTPSPSAFPIVLSVTADSPQNSTASRTARHIVVVEDQQSLAEAIAVRLRSEGFVVTMAFDGPTGVATCLAVQPDAVVLDLNLPGFDGLEVCRQIQRDRRIPVVMLTARDSETDLLVGLAVGADDYITKPFSQRELVARIHALLRRSATAHSETAAATTDSAAARSGPSGAASAAGLSSGSTGAAGPSSGAVTRAGMFSHLGVTLDAVSRTVEFLGSPVHLTVTEFDLSHWFLQFPKVVFTREQLLRQVWGYADGSGERTVDSHVQAVRKKLGAEFVRTVHGVGYALGPAPSPGSGPRSGAPGVEVSPPSSSLSAPGRDANTSAGMQQESDRA